MVTVGGAAPESVAGANSLGLAEFAEIVASKTTLPRESSFGDSSISVRLDMADYGTTKDEQESQSSLNCSAVQESMILAELRSTSDVSRSKENSLCHSPMPQPSPGFSSPRAGRHSPESHWAAYDAGDVVAASLSNVGFKEPQQVAPYDSPEICPRLAAASEAARLVREAMSRSASHAPMENQSPQDHLTQGLQLQHHYQQYQQPQHQQQMLLQQQQQQQQQQQRNKQQQLHNNNEQPRHLNQQLTQKGEVGESLAVESRQVQRANSSPAAGRNSFLHVPLMVQTVTSEKAVPPSSKGAKQVDAKASLHPQTMATFQQHHAVQRLSSGDQSLQGSLSRLATSQPHIGSGFPVEDVVLQKHASSHAAFAERPESTPSAEDKPPRHFEGNVPQQPHAGAKGGGKAATPAAGKAATAATAGTGTILMRTPTKVHPPTSTDTMVTPRVRARPQALSSPSPPPRGSLSPASPTVLAAPGAPPTAAASSLPHQVQQQSLPATLNFAHSPITPNLSAPGRSLGHQPEGFRSAATGSTCDTGYRSPPREVGGRSISPTPQMANPVTAAVTLAPHARSPSPGAGPGRSVSPNLLHHSGNIGNAASGHTANAAWSAKLGPVNYGKVAAGRTGRSRQVEDPRKPQLVSNRGFEGLTALESQSGDSSDESEGDGNGSVISMKTPQGSVGYNGVNTSPLAKARPDAGYVSTHRQIRDLDTGRVKRQAALGVDGVAAARARRNASPDFSNLARHRAAPMTKEEGQMPQKPNTRPSLGSKMGISMHKTSL
eukprot:TRINITY_DN13339_c0_g1_i1.p1 TRINITY_DN13339_c0_g1~~TRINITY_DN13339_c0_g1_i1.p1  ORF type:complete len:775 (+),score=162.05 TRINITY_DN13339_c0_g1_i1:256-2580(+)